MSEDLTRFLETVAPETHLRVERELGDGFVVLKRDEAERRQAAQDVRCSEDIVIELLRNSRDAGATAIYVATTLEAGQRLITVIDNGCGIPERLHDTVFEPRVTSKLDSVHMDTWGIHGRGMALYSIRQNCLQARVCVSAPGLGCAMATRSDISTLPERTDQSGFPTFTLESEGRVKIGGPKNILRTCAEFAMQHRGQVSVFVGTPTEIAATLVDGGLQRYSLAELSLKPDEATVPFAYRPAFSHSPQQLAELLENLGIQLSTRTARRILDGEIAPLQPMHEIIRELLSAQPLTANPTPAKRSTRKSVVKISPEDIRNLRTQVKEDFRPLAQRYYLDGEVEPRVSVNR